MSEALDTVKRFGQLMAQAPHDEERVGYVDTPPLLDAIGTGAVA
jgi:hypothetical protein